MPIYSGVAAVEFRAKLARSVDRCRPTTVRQVYAKRPFNAAVSISLPYMGQTMRKGEFRRCSSLKGQSGCHQVAITRDRRATGIDCFWPTKYTDNRRSGGAKRNGIDCMRNRRYFFSDGASRPLRRLTVHFDSVPAVEARRHGNSDRSHAYLLPERVYPDAGRQSAQIPPFAKGIPGATGDLRGLRLERLDRPPQQPGQQSSFRARRGV